MPRKNWEKVADKEFESMAKEWQEDWVDLRKRVSQRH